MTENISWKQKIKKLQIVFFIFAVVWYYTYNYVSSIYDEYSSKKNVLTDLKINKITSKEEELNKLKQKLVVLKKINDNYKSFVIAYNACYSDYVEKLYWIEWKKITSLRDCMDQKIAERAGLKYDHFIKTLKDVDIVKIAVWFGINKNNLTKFNFDQKVFLRSLDQHVFDDTLEKRVDVITLWQPVLIDKKLQLYKVSFSFPTEVDYEKLVLILKKMQNDLAGKKYNNLYYTISNVSNFDMSNTSFPQKINIQWNFYFTK